MNNAKNELNSILSSKVNESSHVSNLQTYLAYTEFVPNQSVGWDGFVCSEYEGQRFALPGEPIHDIDQVAAHQAMMRAHLNDGLS